MNVISFRVLLVINALILLMAINVFVLKVGKEKAVKGTLIIVLLSHVKTKEIVQMDLRVTHVHVQKDLLELIVKKTSTNAMRIHVNMESVKTQKVHSNAIACQVIRVTNVIWKLMNVFLIHVNMEEHALT